MLIISKGTKTFFEVLEKEYTLREVGEPQVLLRSRYTADGETRDYFYYRIRNIHWVLPNHVWATVEARSERVNTPIDPKDHPELDTTFFLDNEEMPLYWKLLSMLQWTVTIRRIDIMCAVMTIDGFRCWPRMGHLNRLKRVLGFLMQFKSCSIKFRTALPNYSEYLGKMYDWAYVYGMVEEEISYNMPKAKRKEVLVTMFADANLYHDQVTRRSVTKLFMLLNRTPIDWFS